MFSNSFLLCLAGMFMLNILIYLFNLARAAYKRYKLRSERSKAVLAHKEKMRGRYEIWIAKVKSGELNDVIAGGNVLEKVRKQAKQNMIEKKKREFEKRL